MNSLALRLGRVLCHHCLHRCVWRDIQSGRLLEEHNLEVMRLDLKHGSENRKGGMLWETLDEGSGRAGSKESR